MYDRNVPSKFGETMKDEVIDLVRRLFVLFMYTASVMFDYYCRDSELSYIGGIGFQSTPPLEGAGVFNVPEGDSLQNTEPPFIA